ncbi:MAG: NDP-hexose 2,3-dehydratase family protein, partial [Actinobacteria bacterium]|nr:NDP-hexose 2,3-dehydratase family protein [Actinomycetota bacterium]
IDRLIGWHIDGGTLRPVCTSQPFSVIGVVIEGGRREVTAWSQPLLARSGTGVLGFLTQVRRGTLHLLVQASAEPGCNPPLQLMPTLVCNHDCTGPRGCDEHRLSEWFPRAEEPHIRFATFHSEEGGRFWSFDYRYLVAEAPPDAELDLSGTYRWMTLDQVGRFRARGNVSVEARNLLACLGPALVG